MGPPNAASCASPESPDTPCGVTATRVDREPYHGSALAVRLRAVRPAGYRGHSPSPSAHAWSILLAEEAAHARSRRLTRRAAVARETLAFASATRDLDPEGSTRLLVSRPRNVRTSRRSKSSPNHRRRVIPGRVRKATVFHGVSCPSAHAERGSDSCRDCLPRLRGVLELSQSLDALLRPKPVRPCFMPVAPLGFALSEVFPLR